MVLQKGQPPPGWPFCVFRVVSVATMSNGLALRDKVAKLAVQSVNRLSRLVGRGSGTVAGGRVGLRIAPNLLTSLARGRSTVLVSGTNGKTTTTSMIAVGWGASVVTNATGSNMPPGHVAALVTSSSPRVVLEVDEAWLPHVLESTTPRVVVLLNLSRDQLDRASEVRQLAERWRRAFADSSNRDLVVVANANDPIVVYAAETAKEVRWCDVPTTWLGDAVSCPKCTNALSYEAGQWHCQCGFAKPQLISTTLGEELVVDGEHVTLNLLLPGDFNRANAAIALCALGVLGVGLGKAAIRIGALASIAGRFSLRHWNGHSLRLLLAKNPAGFEALLSTVPNDAAAVWIAINARIADGRDPSWLYDVPFEQLRGHQVLCFGERRLDLAARLEYAQVDFDIVDDESKVVASNAPVQLIANYTAFSDWLARSKP
jgi:UDP-N-acetylmuramyl tripeptide synthase